MLSESSEVCDICIHHRPSVVRGKKRRKENKMWNEWEETETLNRQSKSVTSSAKPLAFHIFHIHVLLYILMLVNNKARLNASDLISMIVASHSIQDIQ